MLYRNLTLYTKVVNLQLETISFLKIEIHMLKISIICLAIILLLPVTEQAASYNVRSDLQYQLDSTLSGLVSELRTINTTNQNNKRLQRQIDFTWNVFNVILN